MIAHLNFRREHWTGVLAWVAISDFTGQKCVFSKDSALYAVEQLGSVYGIKANIEYVSEPGNYNVFNVYVFFNDRADEAEFILKASSGFEVDV